jgi:hypothetical protein
VQRIKIARSALALSLVLNFACERSAFVCAERYGTSETDLRRCDGAHERCVCYTQRCAKPDRTCPSGYEYTDTPIGSGKCVLDEHLPQKGVQDFADEETGVCVDPDGGAASQEGQQ